MKKILLLSLLSFIIAPMVGSFGMAFVGLGVLGSVVGIVSQSMPGVAMMAIPVVQAQALFTKNLINVYREQVSVTGFLTSFFTVKESLTKFVSIAVRRNSEKVAVDVHRFSDGKRNKFSLETEKDFLPPYFDEYLNANEHQLYDTVIAMAASGNTTFFAQMTQELAENVMDLRKKIERAIEIMCSQIFETGIVTLTSGIDIDFKRDAASIIAYNAANDFEIGTVSPYKVLQDGCDFIRQKGKTQAGTFNAILGDTAMQAFLLNTIVKERADIRNFSLDMIREPQRNSSGGTLHGVVSCGSYNVRLWTYPEFFDNASDVSTPYIDPKKVIILPEVTNFDLAFAAVPQLISDNGTIPQRGAFLIQDFRNEEKGSHTIHVKSAPLPVPVAIDTIYTVEVIS